MSLRPVSVLPFAAVFVGLPLAVIACGDAITNQFYTVVCNEAGAPVVVPNVPEGGTSRPQYCYSSCDSNTDCQWDREVCNRHRCRMSSYAGLKNTWNRCESDTVTVNVRGDRRDCTPYTCSAAGGCGTFCNNSTMCAPGYICELSSSRCVAGQNGGRLPAQDLPPTKPYNYQSCVRTCAAADGASSADCEDNEMCYHGECMLRVPVCSDAQHVTFGDSTDDCGVFKCDRWLGECPTRCHSDLDCASGYACCGSTGGCVPVADFGHCPQP